MAKREVISVSNFMKGNYHYEIKPVIYYGSLLILGIIALKVAPGPFTTAYLIKAVASKL